MEKTMNNEKEIKRAKSKGRLTLPSEENFLDETKEMMERLGADALRPRCSPYAVGLYD